MLSVASCFVVVCTKTTPRPSLKKGGFFSMLVPFLGVLAFLSCSSVERISVERAALDPNPPKIRPGLLLARRVSARDYKLRKTATKHIRIGIYDASPKGPSQSLRQAAFLQIKRALSDAGVSQFAFPGKYYSSLAKQEGPEGIHYAYCKAKKLDGLLAMSLVPEGERGFELRLRLLDPVYGFLHAERSFSVRIRNSTIDSSHQAELFYKNKYYSFLSARSAPVAAFPRELLAELRVFVQSTVLGNLEITATNPAVRVYLYHAGRRRSLGSPPFSVQKLPEGLYTLVAYRKGFPVQRREFYIRAGRTQSQFLYYPDDDANASVAILSSPSGQRVALDNKVLGKTPFYAATLEPGSYELELSRQEEQVWIRTVSTKIETQPGRPFTRALFTNYKTQFGAELLNEDFFGFTKEEGKASLSKDATGLAFQSTKASPRSWLGLVSRPLLLADFAADLEIEETPDRVLRFGLIGGEEGDVAPALLLHLENGAYSVLRYENGKLIEPKESWKTKRKEGKENSHHRLRIEYDAKESLITFRIDGTKVFSEKMPALFIGNTARLLILTRASQADGRLLAYRFRIFTGLGLSEEK